jgi:hypothetical protein
MWSKGWARRLLATDHSSDNDLQPLEHDRCRNSGGFDRQSALIAAAPDATVPPAGDVAPAAYDRHGSPVAPLGAFSARCALEICQEVCPEGMVAQLCSKKGGHEARSEKADARPRRRVESGYFRACVDCTACLRYAGGVEFTVSAVQMAGSSQSRRAALSPLPSDQR